MGTSQHKPRSFGTPTRASQLSVRSVVQVSKDKRITNPSAYPRYSITNVSKTQLEMPRMEMRITNVPALANLHDNSGMGTTLLQMIVFQAPAFLAPADGAVRFRGAGPVRG